jgi:hypothetical protein
VDNDELMTIGRFARLTGLPVGTRRHYDEVGLLLPASVGPDSGYRRYRREQARRARQIAMLRWDGLLPAGSRPSQIKIAVDDVAVAFYVKSFGFRYEVVQRTERADYSAFMFGTYGQADFFLMHLIVGRDRMDLPGPSTFGLLVDDLDACTPAPSMPGRPRPWPRTMPRACPGARPSATPAATGSGSTKPDNSKKRQPSRQDQLIVRRYNTFSECFVAQ